MTTMPKPRNNPGRASLFDALESLFDYDDLGETIVCTYCGETYDFLDVWHSNETEIEEMLDDHNHEDLYL